MSQGNKRKHEEALPPAAASSVEPRKRAVEWYRHCPLCWGGQQGAGDCYSTERVTDVLSISYYKCDKCAHTWSIKVKREVLSIEHRVVELRER